MKIKIGIFVACVMAVLLSVYVVRFCDRKKNSVNENDYIKQSIETIIEIQYCRVDKTLLSNIATNDFIKNLTEDFYKGFRFYKIDKSFMETCRKTDDGNMMVSVRIEDRLGSYIQVFTLTKNENNRYLISKLQYDI